MACRQYFAQRRIPSAAVNQRPVLTARGWRNPGASHNIGDVVACFMGRMVIVECKTGNAGLSATQAMAASEWRSQGALWWTIRTIDQLDAALEELIRDHQAGLHARAATQK